MAKPVDAWGRYRVVLPLDVPTRLGFSQPGAQQLKDALPLTSSADRQRLAALLAQHSAAAARHLATGAPPGTAGLSALGAKQAAAASEITAHSDRLELVGVIAAIAAAVNNAAADLYDYPGAYASRFDSPG